MLKHSLPAATLALALLATGNLACSNDESSGGGSNLSGTYNTDVTLLSSTCAFTVQDNPTTVRVAGGSITLTHAGNSFSGIIDADSSFATQEKVIGVYHLSISGDFTAAGIDAQVNVSWSNTPCNAVVRWAGPKA